MQNGYRKINKMNTRIFLILIGVASLTAGCFLAKDSIGNTAGKLSGTGTDRAGLVNTETGNSVDSSGRVRVSGSKQQADDTGDRAGVSNKRDIGDSNLAGLDNLSKGDRVRVRNSVNPGNGYDFVYVGRHDEINNRQLYQIIGWSVASSGIAFIAGMMVYRNNKKKLERVIITAIEAGETAEEVIRKYIKK